MHSAIRSSIFLLFVCGLLVARARAADPGCGEGDSEIAVGMPGGVRITISQETTFVTGPLRDDGYVDYVAALNRRSSQGVTAENNAAILLWQAYGPLVVVDAWKGRCSQILGVPVPPEDGEYLVDLSEFVEHLPDEQRKLSRREIQDRYEQLTSRPWSREEFPVAAAWLAANRRPLARVVKAAQSSHYFWPLVAVDGEEPWDGLLLAALLPHLSESREAARMLTARAMFHLAAGNTDRARQDLLACHRLARLVGQGPTLVEGLVGFALDHMAFAGDVQLAHHGKLSPQAIRDWQAELRRLPPQVKTADKIDVCERFAFLDVVCALARSRPVSEGMRLLKVVQTLSYLSAGDESSPWLRVLDVIVSWMCDWDYVARMGNHFYDRLVAAARQPSRVDRVAALEELNKEIMRFSWELRDSESLRDDLLALKSPRRILSERIGKVLISLLIPAVVVCVDSEDRHATRSELTQLALTLAAYRAEHGTYPKQLADLVPAYVSELPEDMFSGDPPHYQRRGRNFVLYSVGPNGEDDGGREREGTSDDIVVRTLPRK